MVGAILGLTAQLARDAIVDVWSARVAVATLGALLWWRPNGVVTIGGAALAGLAMAGIR